MLITSSQITVQDADCEFEPVNDEPVEPVTDEELHEALESGQLTAEHCLWMHQQGISWEISVE